MGGQDDTLYNRMKAYYNEIDKYAAQWLRNLIAEGLIVNGDVDERSIEDVKPDELLGYTQCHFFAGIGGWSFALRLAGWPDDRPVWTGSCPCQPFSAAGKGGGFADERHLWPAFHHLIRVNRPPAVFGEQVASKDGLTWLDLVQADLEGEGYTTAAGDICAAGFGAPHIRQRLYWVADVRGKGLEERQIKSSRDQFTSVERSCDVGGVGISDSAGREQGWTSSKTTRQGYPSITAGCGNGPNPTNGFWRDPNWLGCQGGKFRPVKSGTFPLANGAPARVGRLRAYGNAIVAPQAAEFIAAYMECIP